MEMNQLNDPQVEEKEMDITEEVEEVVLPKKKLTILDTRMAIRSFKQSPEGLDAFVMACNHEKTGGSTPEMFGIHFKRVVNSKTLDPPQLDHLHFIKYYDIVLKCKQERLVSALFTCKY